MGEPHVEDVFDTWLRTRIADPKAGLLELYDLAAKARGVTPTALPADERERLTALALPALEPGFEVLPNSDRFGDSIELVPYDPRWPAQFESWRARLLEMLPSPPRLIEHFGSTAVPGLAAKPIVDILISVDDIREESSYVAPIESLGVQLRSRNDQRRFFRPFPGRPRDVHIHVCDSAGEFEARSILFRDILRSDPEARAEYLAAKHQAARRWAHDRIAYTESKTEVVERLLSTR